MTSYNEHRVLAEIKSAAIFRGLPYFIDTAHLAHAHHHQGDVTAQHDEGLYEISVEHCFQSALKKIQQQWQLCDVMTSLHWRNK